MREGWLLSDGEVIASAVADDALLSSVLPQRLLGEHGAAAVVPARGLLFVSRHELPLELVSISREGLIVELRPLRSWRPALPSRGGGTLALVPAVAAERARLAPGRHLEFREGR